MSECDRTYCSFLYFSCDTREVVTTTFDAIENHLNRTFLHSSDAFLSNHSSLFSPELFRVCITYRYAELKVVCTSTVWGTQPTMCTMICVVLTKRLSDK